LLAWHVNCHNGYFLALAVCLSLQLHVHLEMEMQSAATCRSPLRRAVAVE